MIVDRAVGIDLGTTNSEVAVLVPSEREILVYQDRFGRKTIPSAVAWDASKNAFLVGRTARARRGKEHPPVESIKRSMGQAVKVSIGPSSLAPEEVSAKILGELKTSMAAFLAERAGEGVEMPVARAVITVPAYFDAPQVEATRKAGELAGLDVIGILQEPDRRCDPSARGATKSRAETSSSTTSAAEPSTSRSSDRSRANTKSSRSTATTTSAATTSIDASPSISERSSQRRATRSTST